MDILNKTCDICDRDRDTKVAGSPLGAVSFAYCQECLNKNAVSKDILINLAKSPETIRDDFLDNHTVFVDGEYIPSRKAWETAK